jgi:hypothetical protein
MFSIFNKKDKPEVTDMVFMSRLGKYKDLFAAFSELNTVLIVCYFKETGTELKKFMDGTGTSYREMPHAPFEPGKIHVIQAEHLLAYQADLSEATCIFMEHFPSYSREDQLLQHLYQTLKVRRVFFYVSVDEPLFRLFGGEKLVDLMKKLGLSEEEAVSHTMVTQSIERAQKKLEESLRGEIQADSAEAWIRLNTKS